MDWAIRVFSADQGILSGEMFCLPWGAAAGQRVGWGLPPRPHGRQHPSLTCPLPPRQTQPTPAFAVSSSHVSTVSQADRRSDSPNSYFFDQPRGA